MVIGAIMLLLSFTTLDWYPGSQGADALHGISFTDLHHNLGALLAPAATKVFFGWASWLLLILLIIVGFGANLPISAANELRVLGLFLGLVGAAFTYYALSEYMRALRDHGGGSGGALDNAQAGIWLALIGYLLAGAGAMIGPLPAKRPGDASRAPAGETRS
jgi:hypothetical protein